MTIRTHCREGEAGYDVLMNGTAVGILCDQKLSHQNFINGVVQTMIPFDVIVCRVHRHTSV